MPGGDATGIVSAMEFLAEAKVAAPRLSGTVAVVGGGSVALDAARTAVRLGAERVSVICLERLEPGLKDSMPALMAEIEDGLAEGIEIHPSRGVDSFVTVDGRVSAVRCVECLSVRDEDGRFNPVYGDCVLPEVIEAQTVILAIGQVADATLVPAGFATDALGSIRVDEAGLRTAGLWAAGDAVSGASTVVEALAAGKKAAEVVARYLRGEELDVESTGEAIVAAAPPEEKVEEIPRTERRCRPGDERKARFPGDMAGIRGPAGPGRGGALSHLREQVQDRLPGRLPGLQAVSEVLSHRRDRDHRGGSAGVASRVERRRVGPLGERRREWSREWCR